MALKVDKVETNKKQQQPQQWKPKPKTGCAKNRGKTKMAADHTTDKFHGECSYCGKWGHPSDTCYKKWRDTILKSKKVTEVPEQSNYVGEFESKYNELMYMPVLPRGSAAICVVLPNRKRLLSLNCQTCQRHRPNYQERKHFKQHTISKSSVLSSYQWYIKYLWYSIILLYPTTTTTGIHLSQQILLPLFLYILASYIVTTSFVLQMPSRLSTNTNKRSFTHISEVGHQLQRNGVTLPCKPQISLFWTSYYVTVFI
jgi:hypothetical protein